jgi:hypothetical protein
MSRITDMGKDYFKIERNPIIFLKYKKAVILLKDTGAV